MAVSIIIADDFPAFRRGVRAWLEEHADFQVIGEAPDGPETIRLISHLQPDILVTDLHMPGRNGLEVLESIRQRTCRTRAVIYSSSSEEAYLVEALRKGALAYILKTAPAETLVRAVRSAVMGAYFLGPPFSEQPLQGYLKKAKAGREDPLESLTPREREVLHFVVMGNSSAEIAGLLHISPRTVEQHRAQLMRKLRLRNLPDLIRFALRRGIISLED